MVLVVGTDTYITIAEANSYWSDRNNSIWSAAIDADKEKALRESTQYLDNAYSYIGTHPLDTQLLAWPRNSAFVLSGNLKGVLYDSNVVPPQIKAACAELALDALSGRLRATQERGGAIKREKVDVIEIEYSDFAPSQKTFDFVTLILKPLLRSGSNQASLERV
jgi:hypothetical protein